MVAPGTLQEFSDFTRETESATVESSGSLTAFWGSEGAEPNLSLRNFTGIVELSPADQVVTVRTGTRIADLQTELADAGLWFPFESTLPSPIGEPDATIAESLALALPHAGRFGNWRDWVLGATVLLSDGTTPKSGSRVVKSVAGYDAHKFFVGARHTLGLFLQVHLRVRSLHEKRESDHIVTGNQAFQATAPIRIIRLDASLFQAALGSNDFVWADPKQNLIWTTGSLVRDFEIEWRSYSGSDNWRIRDPELRRWMCRAKKVLDPRGFWNPRESKCFQEDDR